MHVHIRRVPPKVDRHIGPGLSPSSRLGFSLCRALGSVSIAMVGEPAQSSGPHTLGPSQGSRAAAVAAATTSAAFLGVTAITLGGRGRCCCSRRCRSRAVAGTAVASCVPSCVPRGCPFPSSLLAACAWCRYSPARLRYVTTLYSQVFFGVLLDTAGGPV